MDGCTPAANLFSEIARDEALHRRDYATALRAVTNPRSGTVIPTGERVPAVPVPAGTPKCGGKTLANLGTAMRGEAFANAKYTLYANRARASGQPRVATLFENAAHQELNEHFAEEAALAGLVRDNAANLRTAMAGERAEATTTYPGYARQAAAVGDTAAARLFREIARDEARHARTFAQALGGLRR